MQESFDVKRKKVLDRNKLQAKAVKLALSKQVGLLYLAPGVGKTKISIMIAEEMAKDAKHINALFVSTRNDIIGKQFDREKSRWLKSKNITFTTKTIQSVYKEEHLQQLYNYDLIILDEIDEYGSFGNKYFANFEKMIINKSITNYTPRIIGTTGTLTKIQENYLNRIDMPVLLRVDFETSQKYNLVNQVKVEVHLVPLDNTTKIKRELKVGSKLVKWQNTDLEEYFRLKDASAGVYWKEIIELENQLSPTLRHINGLPELTVQEKHSISERITALKVLYDEVRSLFNKLSADSKHNPFWHFFCHLWSTAQKGKELIRHYEAQGDRILIFSVLEEHMRMCTDNVYTTKSGKKGLDARDKFNLKMINHLATAKKVDRGVSFEGVTVSITLLTNGSETSFTQKQKGRGTRLEKDEVNKAIVLMPALKNEKGEEIPINSCFSKFINANGGYDYIIINSKGEKIHEWNKSDSKGTVATFVSVDI